MERRRGERRVNLVIIGGGVVGQSYETMMIPGKRAIPGKLDSYFPWAHAAKVYGRG